MQSIEFITPTAAISTAEETEEEKEEDYFFPVIEMQLRMRTFNDMTFDELAADLGIYFLFERKNRVIKVYSLPSKAYQSIGFRVPEEIHQWEDTFHMCQEDFDTGGDLRNEGDYQDTEDEEEVEENLAADEAVADGLLFRDNIAYDMWDQYVAYCLANA